MLPAFLRVGKATLARLADAESASYGDHLAGAETGASENACAHAFITFTRSLDGFTALDSAHCSYLISCVENTLDIDSDWAENGDRSSRALIPHLERVLVALREIA